MSDKQENAIHSDDQQYVYYSMIIEHLRIEGYKLHFLSLYCSLLTTDVVNSISVPVLVG